MKDLFYFALATALLFTSCNKEEKFEDIEFEDDIITRIDGGGVNVSLVDNTLYFTWNKLLTTSVSILVTDQDGHIIYNPPIRAGTTSLSHTYAYYDGFFKISIQYSEPPEECFSYSQDYFCIFGQIYKFGEQPPCNHRCFDAFPESVYRYGNFIRLYLIGEYTMVVYPSMNSGKSEIRRNLYLPPPQSGADNGNLVHVDRLGESGSYQKVRIFTKDRPYGPEICNSFIEANMIIEEDNGVPTNEPTGSVYFSYCNNYY